MGLIYYLGKTFFDRNAYNLDRDLKIKHIIVLRYCTFEEFDAGLEVIRDMLDQFGWVNLCQVNEFVFHNLVR